MSTETLRAADRAHVWHPFTQMRGWQSEDAPIIERGEGSLLFDTDGNAYIDGVSSLWCNVLGHRHPAIDAAVKAQLDRVAHTTMLGLSHPGAIELAERLIGIAPPGLNRVFFSDNGSTAAEVALKMAFQHFQHSGRPERREFVCLKMSYHGDTLGSVSVGGIDLFHTLFRPLLFDAHMAEPGDAGDMARILEAHGERIAAVIMEPLVQGAAGMLVHPPGYLRAVRELCNQHGVLLICDEVATGFGRTGTMFACQQEGVTPDLMCVAKGLTGGYLPLAATLAAEEVYRSFLGEFAEFKTFFHGHTYTGNPLACAAALATLEVLESDRVIERLADKIDLLGALLAEHVAPLPAVGEIRHRGFMTGIELSGFGYEERIGHQVTLAARERGAIIRPLGDVVVLMPPLSISDDELRRLVAITGEAIAAATSSRRTTPDHRDGGRLAAA
ncbi:MAG TPA: adenosylmethionine--8-amino-7-oxononanoate transaminase [Solirubrobacteraceae bacterium]|nr:adenosylmethionine--8-amino-7-oxononanoate transaminase [Solirubrobacteraceae bacterium]